MTKLHTFLFGELTSILFPATTEEKLPSTAPLTVFLLLIFFIIAMIICMELSTSYSANVSSPHLLCRVMLLLVNFLHHYRYRS